MLGIDDGQVPDGQRIAGIELGRFCQRLLGLREPLLQRIRPAEIAENEGVVRIAIESRAVMNFRRPIILLQIADDPQPVVRFGVAPFQGEGLLVAAVGLGQVGGTFILVVRGESVLSAIKQRGQRLVRGVRFGFGFGLRRVFGL